MTKSLDTGAEGVEREPSSEPGRQPGVEDSGAFPIDRARVGETMLPTTGASGTLLELATLVELEPTAVSLIPEPPQKSAIDLKRLRESERAQLQIEDLSLRYDNPLNASSLLPPPESASARARRVALRVSAACVIVAAAVISTRGTWTKSPAGEQATPRLHSVPVAQPHASAPEACTCAGENPAPITAWPRQYGWLSRSQRLRQPRLHQRRCPAPRGPQPSCRLRPSTPDGRPPPTRRAEPVAPAIPRAQRRR
jgi:hypothetical protein